MGFIMKIIKQMFRFLSVGIVVVTMTACVMAPPGPPGPRHVGGPGYGGAPAMHP
jgi:hypothetical protein